MWVIWNTFTGEEYDTVESAAEARSICTKKNGEEDPEGVFTFRREDSI